MVREKRMVFVVVVALLSLVSMVQAQDRQDGGPGGPRPRPDLRPASPLNVAPPIPLMRQQAEELRARAREAQALADRLRRQADELDQVAKQQMDRGRGSQNMEQRQRQLAEIKDAIGRAEREGRGQDAAALRRRAEELTGRLQPRQPGPGRDERQEIKGKIERLRNEARMAKEQGRVEDSQRAAEEADRLEQKLREQGPRGGDQPGRLMPPEVQDILKAAEQAEREGRNDDARRMREKAETIARGWQEQRGRQSNQQPGPRDGEPQEIKGKIERLRNEARMAKEQGRQDDSQRVSQEADRLEQQLREQGPPGTNEPGRPMPPEVQDILRSAEQAERAGRMDDARRQREKAESVVRQLQEQKRQGPEQPSRQFKDEIMRGVEDLKKEIGRLWQAVNELRNRPQEGKPM